MCVDKVVEHYHQIDVLVNNAHASRLKGFLEITDEDLALSMDTGFYATFYLCQLAIPYLKETQGNIINFGSGAAIKGDVNQGAYAVSKEAVRDMTKAAAHELSPFNIKVNSVHPGVIHTPMLEQPGVKEAVEKFKETIPMRRVAQAEEVSNLIIFLASDEASYSTDSEFVIDGGITGTV